MKTLAASLVGLAMLAAPAQSFAQEQLLETMQLLVSTDTPPPVTSNTVLRADVTYRIVASGSATFTTRNAPNPFNNQTASHDPLYCFARTLGDPVYQRECDPPERNPILGFAREVDLVYQPNTSDSHLDQIHPAPATSLPYTSDHRYERQYASNQDTRLRVRYYNPQFQRDVPSHSGSFTVEIWGPPPAPATPGPAAPPAGDPSTAPQSDNRPARVRRVRSCPARNRLSARAAAAARCVWYVSFEVEQRGLPYAPDTVSDELAAVETVGAGAVYFNRKPRRGVKAFGSAAGVFGVHHDYISPALVQREYDTSLEVGRQAIYIYRSPGVRSLEVAYLVTSTTNPECLTAGYLGTTIHGIGGATINMDDDLSPSNNDQLKVYGVGRLCELRGSFRRSSTNRQMRVKISKPRLVRR